MNEVKKSTQELDKKLNNLNEKFSNDKWDSGKNGNLGKEPKNWN
jgi:hypothetical protein